MSNSEDARMRLKSAINALKQLKSTCSDANVAMDIASSVLKRLEDENEQLRGELDDLRDTAEGFEPDAYIKLPVDADGVPIRLNDTVEYYSDTHGKTKVTGNVTKIEVVLTAEGGYQWWFTTGCLAHRVTASREIRHVDLDQERPDSWEQLEYDAECDAFEYASKTGFVPDDNSESVFAHQSVDLVKRAKALAGVEQ